jgi:hypothetical protein
MKNLRLTLIVAAVLLLLGIGYMALLYNYYGWSPENREGKRFFNDFNQKLGANSYWGYKDGQATITVYRALTADQQASIKARLVQLLAEKRDDLPDGVKSVRLRFYRDYDDDTVLAEFEIPAVITPEMEREWGKDPRHPSTERALP